ncbi:alpha-2-macroglobulin-like protein 1 [Python bivittatus]|uniref:Alpha-2-macroglobulin-like protein 1 n=1 Tax=Python bivittatus TaxID=176946 RepID=A0A9F5J6T7_PYTBI|nr:alpha-2-macroglobulin-like protein 1 [Python bivittatus]
MGAAIFLRALTLLILTASAISDPHYLIIFPAFIHHPSTEKFCIFLDSLSNFVHLSVTLEMKMQNHTLLEKDVNPPGTFECASFQVPKFVPRNTDFGFDYEEEVAHVHVLIQHDKSVIFKGQNKVLVKNAHTRTLMELDKPFYKSGEEVKFRIVRLDEKFKAIEDAIPLIKLEDPDKNRIAQWVDVKPVHGIVDLSFPLAPEAALGTYIIKIGKEENRNEKKFTVEEYVLPKFEVLFEHTQLVTTSDDEIPIKVLGRYTYGKPVHGTVHLNLTRTQSYYFYESESTRMFDIKLNYTNQTDKTGYASFTINTTDIKLLQKGYASTIELSAELEEEGTGVKILGNSFISVVTRAVQITFLNLNPFFKHGFPYTGKMKCAVNDVPLKNQTVYLTLDVDNVETHISYITDENGEVHFTLDTKKWKNSPVALRGRYSLLNATQDDVSMVFNDAFVWLKPFYSESNSFLEIQHVEGELPCGKDQEVLVDYILDRKELGPEADHVDFYYLVVSEGNIVSSGQQRVPVGLEETLKGTFSLTLTTSSDLAPTARLLLFTVFTDGEVAADVDTFKINKCFKHKVTLGFSEQEELPGSKVNLHIEAAPGALCSVRAADKSVLLQTNQTLTPDSVYDSAYPYLEAMTPRGFHYHLEDFEPYPCLPSESKRQKRYLIAPWFQSQADVYSLFKEVGMKLFTNTRVKKPVSCELHHFERRVNSVGLTLYGYVIHLKKDFPVAESLSDSKPQALDLASKKKEEAKPMPQALDLASKKKEEAKPRTYFPDTWIWNLIPVETTIRVFQPFFLDLTLPYSVIRGETFQIKVIVFNFLKDCIQVRTTLLESQEVEVKPCPDCQFTTCLCAEEAKVFSWNVTAMQLGHVNISVSSEAEETQELCGNKISVTPTRGRSDTVIKSLLVKPEGVLEEETQNTFLCSSGDPASEDVGLTMPEAVVQDSGRATVSVIGDIMGAALENIDHLLQMPFGCGEQNMVKFVPNIVVLQYLEKTNQATPEIKNKAIAHMKSGYQRQLLYKHDDGSYSAFGKSDKEGNTWLTAFVAKAYGQAKPYIYVDEKHIQDAVHWLGKHQLPSGCFESVGRLFNNALKGGVDDHLSLTAYVTASLLELQLEKNGSMVDDALLCLKRSLSSVNSTYPKALLAYVFTLAGDTETRQQLLRDLEEEVLKTETSVSQTEILAYFLLAYLSKPEISTDDIKHASKIVRILVKLQNPYGGFYSTQDTVVALQGLARYAALTYIEIENLKVVVKSSKGFQHEFHVNKKNRLVLQQASLPKNPCQYQGEVSGDGCAYVQTILRYNHLPQKTNIFTLNVETFPKECNFASRKYFGIQLQVSYIGQRETSNMALIEVNLVSGFIPVKKSLKKLEGTAHVKKVEFDPDKISIYLDQLDNTVQNYNFYVEQEVKVTDLKPAIVKVYDYYHPDDNAVVEYNAPCSEGPGRAVPCCSFKQFVTHA